MSFEKIISIPGLSGLFRMVAQMRNGGFVVESLADARRIPVSSTQRIIMLKDIAVYTHGDDMPLYKVFKMMKEQDEFSSSVSPKAEPADLRTAMKKIMPEFDDERVHASDIRKMFIWYNLVKDIIGTPEAEESMREVLGETTDAGQEQPAEAVVAEAIVAEAAPAPKATRKKKAEPVEEAVVGEAPVKKARKTAKTKE